MKLLGLCERGALFGALLLSVFSAIARAQAPAASTFYLEQTETQFSINLANDSSDVHIFFTSPAYSWVGVGLGQGMKNSLMIIMYPNEKGDNVTVSPRIADGHSEPSFAPSVKLDLLPGTGITDEMFVLKAICRNCRVWPGGAIGVDNSARPMIYAFGPGNKLQSNSVNAPLKRHIRYGRFTMDMVHATGKGGVPANTTTLSGVQLEGDLVRDHDRANLAHAIMGCIALFVLWPLNVLAAGFLRNIRIHIGISIFIMVFLVISYSLGISTSAEYNRSKDFNSAHQVIALIAILPIILMSLLPIKRIAAMHARIPRLHAPLTTLTLTSLLLTGGLGLRLSSAATPVILAYTALTLLIVVFLTFIHLCIRRRGSAYARATTRRRLGEEDERDFGLAQYWARRKLDEDGSERSGSADSWKERETAGSRGGSRGNVFGGGTMPGPHYMLNMHPGVPVTFK